MKNNSTLIAACTLGLAATLLGSAHAATSNDAMDRLHASVTATRDMQQQRWIVQGLRSGRLDARQAARLEREQAALLSAQARLDRHGHETVAQALRLQHRQDVQDWAIRTGRIEA